MMEGFIEACKSVDKKKNGKKGGRLGGTLKRPEFMETLKSYFPFKSPEDLALLQQAVIYDQPLPVIKYMKLFDETRDGDQGKFAETLRDQHLYDSVAVYPAIENAIREEVMKNDARASAEGACETTLRVVMAGIHKYDSGLATAGLTMSPPQPSDFVLRRLVACGLGEPVEKYPFSDFRKVDVEEFCQRLRALVIKRYSLPPEEDDEQKAAKALRSMLPEERKLLEEVRASELLWVCVCVCVSFSVSVSVSVSVHLSVSLCLTVAGWHSSLHTNRYRAFGRSLRRWTRITPAICPGMRSVSCSNKCTGRSWTTRTNQASI